MTTTNESLTFTPKGVWVQPLLSDGYWYTGSAFELVSILVYHQEIDIDSARFYVRVTDSEACERGDVGTVGDYDGPVCHYCGEPLPANETDYCSALCACYADKDNQEGR